MKRTSTMLILVLLSSSAFAGEAREQARARSLAAASAFKLGRFEEALKEYTAAYQLDAHPDLLFNIAQCHRNLGNHDRAIFFLELYLQEATSSEDRDRVEVLIAELEERRRPRSEVETPVVTTTVAASVAPKPPVPNPTTPVPPPPEPTTPAYQQGWFWGVVIGTAAVVGGAVALAVATRRDGVPEGDYRFDLR